MLIVLNVTHGIFPASSPRCRRCCSCFAEDAYYLLLLTNQNRKVAKAITFLSMKPLMISRNIRLVPNDWDRLSILADKHNTRISELVRLAIKEYLKYRV